ncbi:MAG: hypothetical protein WA459_03975 [Stellaceae bacterium]
MSYQALDRQLKRYSDRLKTVVRLEEHETGKVATLVAAEVRFLDPAARAQVLDASPVPLRDRLDELRAFQAWNDLAAGVARNPAVTRAQVIVQNYICFVYLGEACFRALRRVSKPGSVTRRCSKYLTDNPVRAFRNSIAHSNWTYAPDFSALVYWAKKGAGDNEPMSEFSVSQSELNFWQMLSRGVAYAAYTTLESVDPRQ